MKASPLIIGASGLVLVALSCLSFTPKLIWNRTQSAPKGLYAIAAERPLVRGAMVLYAPKGEEKIWLESNGFVGKDWPLLKEVSALSGDKVCRCGDAILINGVLSAEALEADPDRPSLPEWRGCTALRADEVFLLNSHPRSIDGRYFGPQKTDRIAGTAIASWTYGERVSADSEAGAKRVGGLGMTQVSRRARFKACPLDEANSLSAHLFLGDTARGAKTAPVTRQSGRP